MESMHVAKNDLSIKDSFSLQPNNKSNPLFLGFDFGTQSLKAIIINQNHDIVYESFIHYDQDLPQYQTNGGVIRNSLNPLEVTAPSHMFVAALDLILFKMKSYGIDFQNILSISGSAQQHGSVYWVNGSQTILHSLNPLYSLSSQLENSFVIKNAPIWMDSSTSNECHRLEQEVGGRNILLSITGSVAFERFTASQIMKINTFFPEKYNQTERISLISSMVCSLLLGKYAQIDYGDACGMNILNFQEKVWSPPILKIIAPYLSQKLGQPVSSSTIQGYIHPYYHKRYGFSPLCQIVSWTGDNLNTLCGLQLDQGMLALSLGTSDTIFAISPLIIPSDMSHVFINPIDINTKMIMIVYKNGSLTREYIKNQNNIQEWSEFDKILSETNAGNNGMIGFYFLEPEICPKINHCNQFFRFDQKNNLIHQFDTLHEVRAIVEFRLLSMRSHLEKIGINLHSIRQIIATGGASESQNLLQIASNVFGVPVVQSLTAATNAAAYGSALRAHHGWLLSNDGNELSALEKIPIAKNQIIATPQKETYSVYSEMLQRFKVLEKKVLEIEFKQICIY